MANSNSKLNLSESEWQIVLDALSNTIFNEELTEEARKNAKELFLKLQKQLPGK
jgi:septation ring formation regulator EzrA